jgi:hypothetical protein
MLAGRGPVRASIPRPGAPDSTPGNSAPARSSIASRRYGSVRVAPSVRRTGLPLVPPPKRTAAAAPGLLDAKSPVNMWSDGFGPSADSFSWTCRSRTVLRPDYRPRKLMFAGTARSPVHSWPSTQATAITRVGWPSAAATSGASASRAWTTRAARSAGRHSENFRPSRAVSLTAGTIRPASPRRGPGPHARPPGVGRGPELDREVAGQGPQPEPSG